MRSRIAVGPRRLVGVFALVLALATLVPVKADAAPSQGVPDDSGVSAADVALESCVRENRHLAVVFLIDESGSLGKPPNPTDPDDKRVDGLRVALASLLRVGDDPGLEPPTIEVSFLAFAGSTEEVQDWTRLTDKSLDELDEVAASFADRDQADFTDYQEAFLAAKQKLSEHLAERADERLGSCSELFVFTDGRYNVPSATELDEGRARLCDPSGIIDQLRRLNVVTYILSLSLGDDNKAREQLDGIAGTPSGKPCGEDGAPSTGTHRPVEHAEDLIFPPPNKPVVGRSVRFEGVVGLAGFDLVAAIPPGEEPVIITSPSGDVELARGENDKVRVGGATVTARWPSKDVVMLTGTFGDGDEWLGPWDVDLRSDDARSTLELQLDVDIDLLAPEKIQIGEPTSVDVRMTDRDGRPLVAPVLDQLDVSASIVPGRADAVPVPLTRGEGGRWKGAAEVPLDVAASVSTIVVRAELEGLDGVRIDPVIREFDLPTRLPPDYLDLVRRQYRAPSLKGERGEETTVDLPVSIEGSPIADGCLWLPEARLVGPRDVKVRATSRTIGSTEKDCLEIKKGSSTDAVVEVTASSVEDGAASGVLVFRTSSTTKAEDLDIEVEVSLPMSRQREASRLILALVFLGLIGILVPMAVLHLINVATAGLTHAERLRSMRASVVVDDREVRLSSGERVGVHTTGYLDQFYRVRPGTPPKVRPRELEHGGIHIRSYASGSWPLRTFSLFRGPFAVITEPGGRRVIARWVGMRRAPRTWAGRSKSEAPNALPGLWVFVPDPLDPGVPSDQARATIRGQLTVFTLDGEGRKTATDAIADLQRQLPNLTAGERGAIRTPRRPSGDDSGSGLLGRVRRAVADRVPQRAPKAQPAPRPKPPESSY